MANEPHHLRQNNSKIMWSDRYYYLNIYKDESLSGVVMTKALVEFLATIPELESNGKNSFKNKAPFPFTIIGLAHAKDLDDDSGKNISTNQTNLISIVCGKGKDVDFEKLKRVFIQIASYLNWKLVDEETDEGIENYVIWEPPMG